VSLNDVKRRENAHGKSDQDQDQKNESPEFSFIDPLRFRIARVNPGIDVVPEIGTAALRTDLMKDSVLVTWDLSFGFSEEELRGFRSYRVYQMDGMRTSDFLSFFLLRFLIHVNSRYINICMV
jgi:hypothetical protein